MWWPDSAHSRHGTLLPPEPVRPSTAIVLERVFRIGNGHILVIDRSAKGVALVERNTAALTPAGRLFIDGGNPLREIDLAR